MIFNFVSAVLLLASAIQAVTIVSPASGSTIVSGTNIILNIIASTETDTAGTVSVVFTGQNGATASTTVAGTSLGQDVPFYLPATFSSGITTVVATPSGFTGTNTPDTNIVTVVAAAVPVPAPVYPVYPCYNPYYNNCYNPCRKPVCNVPRPRCRIRNDASSSSQDASSIVFSGFSLYLNDNEDQVQEFEQQAQQDEAVAQIQQEMQQQFEEQVIAHLNQSIEA